MGTAKVQKIVHGQLQVIYRLINDNHDDLDLTRTQAEAVFKQLRTALSAPSVTAHVRKEKRRGNR